MAFVINVIKWLMWTVETKFLIETMYHVYSAEFICPFWCETLVNTHSKHDINSMLFQCWPTICDAGPTSTSTGSTPSVCWAAFNPVNTKQEKTDVVKHFWYKQETTLNIIFSIPRYHIVVSPN